MSKFRKCIKQSSKLSETGNLTIECLKKKKGLAENESNVNPCCLSMRHKAYNLQG